VKEALLSSGWGFDDKEVIARNAGGGGVNGLGNTAAVPVGIIDCSVATGGTASKWTCRASVSQSRETTRVS